MVEWHGNFNFPFQAIELLKHPRIRYFLIIFAFCLGESNQFSPIQFKHNKFDADNKRDENLFKRF